jgi:diaminopimelate decarboxylase
VFSGVGKTTAEIDAALAAQIRALHVESPGEVEQILARARAADTVAAVAIRVNPDIAAQTHPYLATGLREAKFGVPFEDVLALARTIARHPNGRLVGLASHIGSQLRDPTPYVDSLKRLVELAGALASEDIHVEYLDLGGGLGVAYGPDDVDLDVIAWGSAIVNAARGVAVPLLFEPGRFLVANAGLLLTRVIGRKQKDGRRFVIVDAGMNDLIRPALYGAYHAIVPIEWPQAGTTTEQVDIVGPVCESGDFLARSRLFPTVQPGDLLAVLSAGAYGMTMASTYNSRPLPAEVLVDGDRSAVVRRRSSVQELMANESPPPWFRDDRSPASTQQPVNPDESTEREK